MKSQRPKTVQYRRVRELRTNYSKRLQILLAGKPRLVVRMTNTQVLAQVVEFTTSGDLVLAAATGKGLRDLGWKYSCKNTPASYLTGLLIGKAAVKKGLHDVILDTGVVTPLHKSRLYAFLRGALDAGLAVPHDSEKEIFPSQDRIEGKHIHLKSDASAAQKIGSEFAAVKKKIMV